MRDEQAKEYAVVNGHPPVAKGVICVDFDSTLFPWGTTMFDDSPPFEGAVEALRAFDDAGLKIMIFTSRVSPTWWDHEEFGEPERLEQIRYVINRLNKWGIPYAAITAEKVPAVAYIDDKAIEFIPTLNNWKTIKDRILNG